MRDEVRLEAGGTFDQCVETVTADEALEVWPVELLGRLLPRHLEIIFRINDDFLAELREAYPDDELRVRSMSIIQEHPERAVRMAYLATVVGAKVNGARSALASGAAAGAGASISGRGAGRSWAWAGSDSAARRAASRGRFGRVRVKGSIPEITKSLP